MRTSRRLLLTSGALNLDVATAAYLAAMPTKPNRPATIAINRFIVGLKTNNLWGKIDGGNILALGDASQAYVDFKVPSRVATVYSVPTHTFTAYRGFQGSGSADTVNLPDSINTGFTPSTAGGQFTQDSAQISVYSNTSGAFTAFDIGANSTHDFFFRITASTNLDGRANDGTTTALATNSQGTGFFTVSRTDATTITTYRNGSSIGSASTVSTGLPATPIRYIQLVGLAGAQRQYPFACYGSGLNSTEAAALNSLTQSLMGVLLVQ